MQQLKALVYFRRTSQMSRAEFFRYRLWRDEVPLIARLRFASRRERGAVERLLNPMPYRGAMKSKTQVAERLRAVGIAVPESLALVGARVQGLDVPRLTSLGDFRKFLATSPPDGLVLKPEDGGQGKQVLVAPRSSAEGVFTIDGRLHAAATLWDEIQRTHRAAGWRLERRIVPHPAAAGLCPEATPTVRVFTLLVGGEVILHAATLKVPRGQSGVDNFSSFDNLAAPVDLQTGRVGKAGPFDGGGRVARHPDSGVPIEGMTVPNWIAVRRTAERGARALAPLRALGWDIALGADGPVVLEANVSAGHEIVQVPQDQGLLHGPFLDLLHESGADFILRARDEAAPGWRDSLPLAPTMA